MLIFPPHRMRNARDERDTGCLERMLTLFAVIDIAFCIAELCAIVCQLRMKTRGLKIIKICELLLIQSYIKKYSLVFSR